ncbi:MAG: DinB family protein [Caldilineaceae bacterium]
MSALQQIQMMFEYNYALYDQVWESVMNLTDEQFTQDAPYAHGSVCDQLIHVAVVDTRWIRGLNGDPDARTYTVDASAYPTRSAAHTFFQEAATNAKAYVAKLDEAALEAEKPGIPMPQWQVLLHVANHGTDHRAQILRSLHDLGAPTFPQDLIIYLWTKDKT